MPEFLIYSSIYLLLQIKENWKEKLSFEGQCQGHENPFLLVS